jgi:hypothetical protein
MRVSGADSASLEYVTVAHSTTPANPRPTPIGSYWTDNTRPFPSDPPCRKAFVSHSAVISSTVLGVSTIHLSQVYGESALIGVRGEGR